MEKKEIKNYLEAPQVIGFGGLKEEEIKFLTS